MYWGGTWEWGQGICLISINSFLTQIFAAQTLQWGPWGSQNVSVGTALREASEWPAKTSPQDATPTQRSQSRQYPKNQPENRCQLCKRNMTAETVSFSGLPTIIKCLKVLRYWKLENVFANVSTEWFNCYHAVKTSRTAVTNTAEGKSKESVNKCHYSSVGYTLSEVKVTVCDRGFPKPTHFWGIPLIVLNFWHDLVFIRKRLSWNFELDSTFSFWDLHNFSFPIHFHS